MNTKLLMIASAAVLGICGILFQFIPHEILRYTGADESAVAPLFLQMIGALCLGFAAMNWMAKTVLIGGIYARPLAIGNFAHFMIGAFALVKHAFGASAQNAWVIWLAAIVYVIFAVAFGVVFFTHPLKNGAPEGK